MPFPPIFDCGTFCLVKYCIFKWVKLCTTYILLKPFQQEFNVVQILYGILQRYELKSEMLQCRKKT